MAAREGDSETLHEALASSGQDIDSPYLVYTGPHLAILGGHVDAALTLIAHGADSDRFDPSGNTPLFLCAAVNQLSDEGSVRVAQALLAQGADPTRVSDMGDSPRSLAEIRGKTKLAALLPATPEA